MAPNLVAGYFFCNWNVSQLSWAKCWWPCNKECLFYWRDLWDSPTQWPMGHQYTAECPICYAMDRDSRLRIYISNTSLAFLLSHRTLAIIKKVQSPSICYGLMGISWEAAFRWMPQNTFDSKSTLFWLILVASGNRILSDPMFTQIYVAI